MASTIIKLMMALMVISALSTHAAGPRYAHAAVVVGADQNQPTHPLSTRDFVSSLYRVCLGPGLSNCLFPLRPSQEDIDQAAANTLPVLGVEVGKRETATAIEKRESAMPTHTGYIGPCGVLGESCRVPAVEAGPLPE